MTHEGLTRRELLEAFLAASAAGLVWTEREAEAASRAAREARQEAQAKGQAYEPRFFTPHEFATVTVLADLIFPADERSGSASQAGVPEFIDFMMLDQPGWQVPIRGGLAWLDHECHRRFERAFVDCAEPQRLEVIDDIAWPARARPELTHGAFFFTAMRDLTASGFFSSRMGIEDVGYVGNRFVRRWEGAPPEVLEKAGVSYEKVKHWYPDS